MKNFLILGNWKENKTVQESQEWAELVVPKLRSVQKTQVVICPAFTSLPQLKPILHNTPIKLGAQTISDYERGTYTGEVSGEMLAGLVEYVIIGHSERRRFFHETNASVAAKVKQALKNNLIPVVCIADKVSAEGTPLSTDEAFNEEYFAAQIKMVFDDLSESDRSKIIFSFEPPSAISSQAGGVAHGQSATIADVEAVVGKAKQIASQNMVLYGGSVKSENVLEYFKSPLIDGVMPGSASLNGEDFARIVLNVEGNM